MTRKGIVFGLSITLCFGLILYLPLKPIIGYLPAQLRLWIAILLKSLLLSGFFYFIIRKYKLLSFSGFRNHISRNYLMLIIPLVYPAAWAYNNFNNSCTTGPTLSILLISLIQGLWEEITFRGVIQGYLIKQSGYRNISKTIFFTTFLFAFGHFTNLTSVHLISVTNQVIYAFFIGLMFSAIQLHVNNILLLGVVHGLLNFLFKSCRPKELIEETTTNPSFTDYLIQAASMALIFSPILLIYWFLMKKIKLPDLYRSDISNEKNSSLKK